MAIVLQLTLVQTRQTLCSSASDFTRSANQLWQLQMQTNISGMGLTTNWFNLTGVVPPYTVNLSLTNPTVFYRLTHP